MKYSETIISKRLRILKMTGMFFMLVLIAWIGYKNYFMKTAFFKKKEFSRSNEH